MEYNCHMKIISSYKSFLGERYVFTSLTYVQNIVKYTYMCAYKHKIIYTHYIFVKICTRNCSFTNIM